MQRARMRPTNRRPAVRRTSRAARPATRHNIATRIRRKPSQAATRSSSAGSARRRRVLAMRRPYLTPRSMGPRPRRRRPQQVPRARTHRMQPRHRRPITATPNVGKATLRTCRDTGTQRVDKATPAWGETPLDPTHRDRRGGLWEARRVQTLRPRFPRTVFPLRRVRKARARFHLAQCRRRSGSCCTTLRSSAMVAGARI